MFSNPNNGKLYHGDLVERSFCYMLALTGNVGRPGSGTRGMSAGFDFLASMPLVVGDAERGARIARPVGTTLSLLLMLIEDYRERVKMDPVDAATPRPSSERCGELMQDGRHARPAAFTSG